MAWQGIPYPISVNQIVANAHLAVESMPKIFIDTGDNTWSIASAMIATIGGSLIAGAIPAYIAWQTIRKNQESIEIDRAAQQSRFDESNKAQLEIATRNFNAQVLSANRQLWIKELRDLVAEFISNMNPFVDINHDLVVAMKVYKDYRNSVEELANKSDKMVDRLGVLSQEYLATASMRAELNKKMDLIIAKISLMLNPSEKEYDSVVFLMKSAKTLANSINQQTDVENIDLVKVYSEAEDKKSKILSEMQTCLKNEWIRVKAGI